MASKKGNHRPQIEANQEAGKMTAHAQTAQNSTSASFHSKNSSTLKAAEGSRVSGHVEPGEPVRFLRAENIAETARRLMEKERKVLSVRSEELSLFHGLDGDEFVTFRAKEKKLQCFYSDRKALLFARPIVRWEKPSQPLSFTGLYFGHLRYEDEESVLENLRSSTWYDGTIVLASELGSKGSGPFYCVSVYQAYGTYAVGRDSTGRAAGLLVWTDLDILGLQESYPELKKEFMGPGPVNLDPKD